MQFTWHLIVIIAAILFGICLFQMSGKSADMTADQVKQADMYLNGAYILWAVAVAVAFYYYFMMGEEVFAKASMPGCGCGEGKASMCSGKATMCGGGIPRY